MVRLLVGQILLVCAYVCVRPLISVHVSFYLPILTAAVISSPLEENVLKESGLEQKTIILLSFFKRMPGNTLRTTLTARSFCSYGKNITVPWCKGKPSEYQKFQRRCIQRASPKSFGTHTVRRLFESGGTGFKYHSHTIGSLVGNFEVLVQSKTVLLGSISSHAHLLSA